MVGPGVPGNRLGLGRCSEGAVVGSFVGLVVVGEAVVGLVVVGEAVGLVEG